MGLTKYKLGQLIKQSDVRNSDGLFLVDRVRGISTGKEFIDTKANMDGVSLTSYKIVNGGQFAYVADTSRRGDKIAIAYNNCDDTILISSIYTVFYISKKELLLPEYLFMYFNRPEFDRYSRYNSWGSARETFTWDDMCDIDLELPSIGVQQKYIDIYNGLIENQKSYERGLDDLKLTCDAYIENLRKKMCCQEIKDYIEEVNNKNSAGKINKVLGISKEGFIDPKQDIGDIHNYYIFEQDNFVYSPPRINIGSIGLYKKNEPAVCSPIYVVFKVKDKNKLLPDYLFMWLKRDEFFRATDFYSIASVRNNFSYDLMCEVKIPIPDIDIQKAVANIYVTYIKRQEINNILKQQIKDICPILIKGSIEEGRKEA